MPEQTSTEPVMAGLPLHHKIMVALDTPGAVTPRMLAHNMRRVLRPETVAAWRARAVLKVLTDHGIDVYDRKPAGVETVDQLAVDADTLYLVWSAVAGTWWGPGGGGYTGDITQAGRFTLDAARDYAGMRSWLNPARPPEVVVAAPSPGLLASADLPRVMQERIEQAAVEAVAVRRAAVASRRASVAARSNTRREGATNNV